jgi:allantoinase
MAQQEQFDLVIGGDVVLPDKVIPGGYIAIRREEIAAIGSGPPPLAHKTKSYPNSLLFPGLIDAQIHAGSFEGVEGLEDATRAAAAGGVTTVVDMPFDEPVPVNSVERLQTKIEAISRLANVDVALYATAPKGDSRGVIRELAEAGAIAIKLSTYEYHPVRFPRFTTGEMYDIFLEAAEIGIPVSFHNEDQELVAHLVARSLARGDRGPAAHGASRPPIAELVANAQILELASHTGVRCHIVHSSVAAGNRIARHYRSLGAKISVETCIHYLIFNEQDMLRLGAFLKINPPIRAEEERLGLWDSVEAGEVDLISTDHVAWPESRKSDPDIFKNGSGVPGLETLLPALYTSAVHQRYLSPSVIARLTAENPARHFGLFPRKGQIVIGADADIAVLSREQRTFEGRNMASKIKWSPFEGMTMAGVVAATYVRGREVYENGSILAKPGYGRFVRPLREPMK